MTNKEAVEELEKVDTLDMSARLCEAHYMSIKALKQEPCEVESAKLQQAYNKGFEDCRQAVLDIAKSSKSNWIDNSVLFKRVNDLPPVTPELKMGRWNNHQIACMLADLFGDTCACNYNDIDEWLCELCDFKDTCCPNPGGVACWEQFLKYSQSRYSDRKCHTCRHYTNGEHDGSCGSYICKEYSNWERKE